MKKSKLQEIKDRWQHVEDRKTRAKERRRDCEEGFWYFALCGFKADFTGVAEEGVFSITKVEEPPNELELAANLKENHLFSAIGRYSLGCNYELGVIMDEVGSRRGHFSLAWWIVSAIRVKTLANFLVVAAADCSWDTIAAAPKSSVSAELIEDFPKSYKWGDDIIVNKEDVGWVSKNLMQFVDLLEVPKFRVAVESLTTHSHITNLRMVLASLWAGIEALTEAQTELRYRISSYIASFLEPAGTKRLEMFHKLQELYNLRSQAVHGQKITDQKIVAGIKETKLILSQVLCKIIEINKIPNKKDFEEQLFC